MLYHGHHFPAILSIFCTIKIAKLGPACQKKSLWGFFAKLLSELQNQILQHDFAILPLRRVIERERKP